MNQFELIRIDPTGRPERDLGPLPEMIRGACEMTAAFYERIGFEPPWVGYISLCGGKPVGGGGFKGPPAGGKVEIAYFTLHECEGRGYATATAQALLAIARRTAPDITVIAQTLPETNASNALLQKLGFAFAGAIDHPEDGRVWKWRLPAPSHTT